MHYCWRRVSCLKQRYRIAFQLFLCDGEKLFLVFFSKDGLVPFFVAWTSHQHRTNLERIQRNFNGNNISNSNNINNVNNTEAVPDSSDEDEDDEDDDADDDDDDDDDGKY